MPVYPAASPYWNIPRLTTMPTVTPSGDITGATDASVINSLLQQGDPVQLSGSPFFMNAPITPQPGAVVLGSNGGTYGQSIYVGKMTRIVGVGTLPSMWSQGPGVGFCRLQDVMFDASAATLTGPCVNLQDGAVEEDRSHIERVYVESPTSDAFYVGTAHQDLKFNDCIVHNAGQHGFNIKASDALLIACISGDCSANGYEIQAIGAEMHGCASFKNQRGVVIAGTIKDCVIVGGSIDRNSFEGLYINSGCGNISVIGSQFHSNDYTNNNVGNIHVGSTVALALSLTGVVFPPLDADATTTPPFDITTVSGSTTGVYGCSFDPTSATTKVDNVNNFVGQSVA